MSTKEASPSPRAQRTEIVPLGVGTTPCAQLRSTGCGSITHWPKPLVTGRTPNTYMDNAGTAVLHGCARLTVLPSTRLVPGRGWVPCGAGEEGAVEDLNRLHAEARWDRETKRFVRRAE